MGMDSQNEMDKSMLSTEARRKFDELVFLLAREKYGPGPPPIDTTFAEIEDFGHQAGRMLGRSLDEHLTLEHAEHFQEATQHIDNSVLGKVAYTTMIDNVYGINIKRLVRFESVDHRTRFFRIIRMRVVRRKRYDSTS